MASCGVCREKLSGSVIKFGDTRAHARCFVCRVCEESLKGQTFFTGKRDSQLYCEPCYSDKFSSRCGGCGKRIKAGSKVVSALGGKWHARHFVCQICEKALFSSDGQEIEFHGHEGLPYCAEHIDEAIAAAAQDEPEQGKEKGRKKSSRSSRSSKKRSKTPREDEDSEAPPSSPSSEEDDSQSESEDESHRRRKDRDEGANQDHSNQKQKKKKPKNKKDKSSRKRKGNCAQCGETITGRFLVALGKHWHLEHFVCVTCEEPFPEGRFFAIDNQPYCETHFNELQPSDGEEDDEGDWEPEFCALCREEITGRIIEPIEGHVLHAECFNCSGCGENLDQQEFVDRKLKFYHPDCYQRTRNLPRCAKCSDPITGSFTVALGEKWHPEHFACETCGKHLGQGEEFKVEKDKVYCNSDWTKLFAPKCFECKRPVDTSYITAMNVPFHQECFVCSVGHPLDSKEPFFMHLGKKFCGQHYEQLILPSCGECGLVIIGKFVRAGEPLENFHQECWESRKDRSPEELVEEAEAKQEIVYPEEAEIDLDELERVEAQSRLEYEEAARRKRKDRRRKEKKKKKKKKQEREKKKKQEGKKSRSKSKKSSKSKERSRKDEAEESKEGEEAEREGETVPRQRSSKSEKRRKSSKSKEREEPESGKESGEEERTEDGLSRRKVLSDPNLLQETPPLDSGSEEDDLPPPSPEWEDGSDGEDEGEDVGEEEEDSDEERVCSECSADLDPDSLFCGDCGASQSTDRHKQNRPPAVGKLRPKNTYTEKTLLELTDAEDHSFAPSDDDIPYESESEDYKPRRKVRQKSEALEDFKPIRVVDFTTEEDQNHEEGMMPLRDLLQVPQYVHCLSWWMERQQTLENLTFLQEVRNYQDMEHRTELLHNERTIAMRVIWDSYLNESTATKSIPVSPEVRRHTLDKIQNSITADVFDPHVFDAAYAALFRLVVRESYREFVESRDFQLMLEKPPHLESLLADRRRSYSFSICHEEENYAELDEIVEKLLAANVCKSHRFHLKRFKNVISGGDLVTWLLSSGIARERLVAVSIGQRLKECSLLKPVVQAKGPKGLLFSDSKDLYRVRPAPKVKKGWPTIRALLRQKQVHYGAVLYKGIRYHRVWCVLSKDTQKLFCFRSNKGQVGHSAVNLKNARVKLFIAASAETGGEIEGMPAYMHIYPMDGTEYVFLLDNAQSRRRWEYAVRACLLPVEREIGKY